MSGCRRLVAAAEETPVLTVLQLLDVLPAPQELGGVDGAVDTDRETTVAIALVSRMGSTSATSPVISTTEANAVRGARVPEANTAPMPIAAYTAGSPAASPNSWWTTRPKAVPTIRPTNSEGAKTPPDPPMPRVSEVATIFANAKNSSSQSPYCPCSAWNITG
ncbi:hypothetical protein RM52_07480 [Microbacterium hominis]|uniref:Uncharacterized protein n=1 Tax=Microbacterium hominis TaxID=162426 RepID=A0A0B4CU71_9MICO|nr:hypothetical protein RM52_07480 [Microbacterium hominis]